MAILGNNIANLVRIYVPQYWMWGQTDTPIYDGSVISMSYYGMLPLGVHARMAIYDAEKLPQATLVGQSITDATGTGIVGWITLNTNFSIAIKPYSIMGMTDASGASLAFTYVNRGLDASYLYGCHSPPGAWGYPDYGFPDSIVIENDTDIRWDNYAIYNFDQNVVYCSTNLIFASPI